jgi:hypothetical protein
MHEGGGGGGREQKEKVLHICITGRQKVKIEGLTEMCYLLYVKGF